MREKKRFSMSFSTINVLITLKFNWIIGTAKYDPYAYA